MGVTAVRLLSSLGLLVAIVQAQNCSRPVGGPNMDLKGNDILLETFSHGTRVTFACNPGYESAGGSPISICNAGQWSAVQMICQRKNCGSAGEVENGHVDYQPGSEFGDKAVVTCNTGYTRVGKHTVTCGTQGWDGRLAVCEVVKCESPPVVTDGSFSPNKQEYDYNDVVQYTCKREYTLNGSKHLSCSDDGTFKPDPPKCIQVKCQDPDIPNGEWSSGARPPYGYLSSVTLVCKPGYTMNGTATQKCELNSQWAPGLPECTKLCEDPRKIEPKVTVSRPPPYRLSDKVTLSCPSGYELDGQPTHTCGENFLWSPGIPKCIQLCEDPIKINPKVIVSRPPPYKLSDKVTLSCPSGYELDGQPTHTCGENFLWSPEIPKCIQLCEDPIKINPKVIVSRPPPYKLSDKVTLSCPSGYELDGQPTHTCGENFLWSPEIPKCIQVCKDPRKIEPKVTVSHPPPYRLSDKVTLSCPAGYELDGQPTHTCGENFLWSPEIPKCTRISTKPAEENGSGVLKPVLITLAVLAIVVLGLFGMRYFGVPPFNRKKKGTRGGNTDKEATNEGEDVALS